MACRNEGRGLAAVKDVQDKSGSESVHFFQLDLASFDSIREFSKKFHEAEQKLDVLINNAAVFESQQKTADGLEMNMGVNHVGHFLLTNLLLDLLKAAAPSRVVIVTSSIFRAAEIKKDEFERIHTFGKWKTYSHSKLANILFMSEMARKLNGSGVTVNALCPGAVKTEAIDKFNFFARIILIPIKWLFFKTPDVGAETHVMLAVEPELAYVSGKFFKDCKITETSSSAVNDDIAAWLWDESEKLTRN